MQTAFTVLICLQFAIIALHDLVEIPGWSQTSQLLAVMGRGKLYAATLVNSIFPGVALVFALAFWHHPKPHYVRNYWLIYCAVTALSAIGMWYVPYFRGATQQQKDDNQRYYAGTYQILPPRGDNPRPNLLHILFHILFVATLTLAIFIAFAPQQPA